MSGETLRVLHMNTERGWRGGEQQALYLADGLKRRGVVNLCIGQPGQPYVERCAASGIDVAPIRTRGEADPFGIAAIRRTIRSFRPDVVLCDIGMPKVNGYDAARRIRAEGWGKNMVLVALTGWGQEDDRQKSADAGFDFHLVKPVEPAALMKLLAGLRTATA